MDRQVSVLVIERPSLFSDSGNRLPLFNPFAAAMAITWSSRDGMNLSLWGLLNF